MSITRYPRPANLPPSLANQDDLQRQREIILQHVLNTSLLFAGSAFLFWLYRISWQVNQPLVWLAGGLLVLLLAVTFIRRLPFGLRAFFVLTLIGAVGVADLLRGGLSSSGPLYLLTFAIVGGAFFGTQRGIITLVAAGIAQILIGWLMVNQHVPIPAFWVMANSSLINSWLYSIFSTALCGIILAGSVFQFTESLIATLKDTRLMARNLDSERAQLEVRVQLRTNELARKASLLEAARQVASEIAAQTDIEPLLNTTVNVVRDRFDFYHAGIFMPDENGEYAVLRAATGDAGRQMLSAGHRLRIGQVGIVGYVMSKGEPRITGNVDEDPAHYVNPVLPETRSEMAVPMKLGDRGIGVLDVQSTRRNAFSSDDVDVLTTIADQISSALEKARLLEQYQKIVEDLQETARQNTRTAWQKHLRETRKRYAYRYRQMKVEPIPADQFALDPILPKQPQVVAQPNQSYSTIQVPIKLRDQVIG
ncbi:MAG TPA: GAF domain-containing protein, partial [Anaerolinea sp.]|nr:GAF domain-containing protein [Anaerolinea sp.]